MQGRPDAMGMRHAASQLRSKADRATAVSARVERQVASMGFTGPAADQFRSAMAAEQDRMRRVAVELMRVAESLEQAAARVDVDPEGFYGAGVRP
jgi:uncharacterized protein YukE